jgi:lipoprotein signal peptidase
MKTAFFILVLIHGLIHVMGFLKAFKLAEIRELSLPISELAGVLWLLAAVLFVVYGILVSVGNSKAWMIGLIAVIISQLLVIYVWNDARFGTIPNIVILVVVLSAQGNWAFDRLIRGETEGITTRVETDAKQVLSEEDVVGLPEPVKKWLMASGAVGRERIVSVVAEQQALMKMKPDQENWISAKAHQLTTVVPPAFIWTVEMKMNPLLNIRGRDKFVDGKGEMLIKLNGLYNVVRERGDKLDEGTIQRYLGELVWVPSLALSPTIEWEALDDLSARATMRYMGTSGSGTFHFNEQGDFVRFSAWRYQGNEPDSEKFEWVITVDEYRTFDGIRVPAKMKATWRLKDGDWTWLDLEIMGLKYNHETK